MGSTLGLMDYSDLNEGQYNAVITESKHVCVLAGAGTGKTKTLVSRIGHLCDQRVSTSYMLALTFTRNAGQEMKERVARIIDKESTNRLFSNTFHSFCVKLLKQYGEKINLQEGFSIYDQDDRDNLLATIIYDYKKKVKASDIVKLYNGTLDRDATPDEEFVLQEMKYRMRNYNAIDFDGLILQAITLLETFPDIRQEVHDQYKYVFVDEFQDTNLTQLKLLQLISPEHLFVIGDDYQSIYGFRGAVPEIIINFKHHYPDAEIIKLEINYRSVKPIIDSANRIIRYNDGQTDKILIHSRQELDFEVNVHRFKNSEIQGNFTAQNALGLMDDYKLSQMAILCRTNKELDEIADLFNALDIPTVLLSSKTDVLKKTHIKSFLSLFKLAINPKDNIAFVSALDFFPGQTLSNMEFQKLKLSATSKSISLYEAYALDHAGSRIVNTLYQINQEIRKYDTYELLSNIATSQGIYSYYREAGLQNRIADFDQLFEKVKAWGRYRSRNMLPKTMDAYLKYLAMKDIQDVLLDKKDGIKITTIHGSKGLEFEVVFVIGLNQGNFPKQQALRTGDLNEERRLMYVAITRARTILHLLSYEIESNYGKIRDTNPSQFLYEIV